MREKIDFFIFPAFYLKILVFVSSYALQFFSFISEDDGDRYPVVAFVQVNRREFTDQSLFFSREGMG